MSTARQDLCPSLGKCSQTEIPRLKRYPTTRMKRNRVMRRYSARWGSSGTPPMWRAPPAADEGPAGEEAYSASPKSRHRPSREESPPAAPAAAVAPPNGTPPLRLVPWCSGLPSKSLLSLRAGGPASCW